MDNEKLVSETDKAITERGRGKAERVALGGNPYGSILRIIAFVAAFILLFGTIFFFAQN